MSDVQALTVCRNLDNEIRLASRLYEVLSQELAALERLDTASIQSLAQEKNQLLLALDSLMADREKILPQSLSDECLKQLEQKVSPNIATQLKQLVGDFRSLLSRCRTQNDINGRIIAANRRSVERQLSMLRGLQPDTVLYASDGRATRLGGHQRYAVA